MTRNDSLAHEIKLFIINNPSVRNQEQIAELFDVSQKYVSVMMAELNISPRRKPGDCVG